MVTTTGPSVIPSTRPGRGGGSERSLKASQIVFGWFRRPCRGGTAFLIQPRWLPPPYLPKASGPFLSEQHYP